MLFSRDQLCQYCVKKSNQNLHKNAIAEGTASDCLFIVKVAVVLVVVVVVVIVVVLEVDWF